jgi:AraC family transcriptional regulator, alkane utilization regulator
MGEIMDVLSDVLHVVRLSGAVFFTAEFTSPWAVQSPPSNSLAAMILPDAECVSLFHVLVEGDCWVECRDHPPVHMESGDVVIFPHGDQHDMGSRRGGKATPIGSLLPHSRSKDLLQLSHGGGGNISRLICGYLHCDQRFNPLIGALPMMLLVRSRDDYVAVEAVAEERKRPSNVAPAAEKWLTSTLQYTINEARSSRPGSVTMLGRLTELMFVEILRQYMQQLPEAQTGWLAGLNDPQVGKALRLMHEDPSKSWTVEELARSTAVSRSALAQRFTDLIGTSPMHYLAEWRIQLAMQMLRDGTHSIPNVAARVGYESEAAFNRAFKRFVGAPPASWRRAARLPALLEKTTT